MSLYTSIYFHPESPRFYPTESQVRDIISALRIQIVEIASGEAKPSLIELVRRKFFPADADTNPADLDLFWETNVSLDRAIELWSVHKPYIAHFSLKHEGLAEELTTVIRESIPSELSRDFIPWDTGVNLGPWEHCDYDTGKLTAKGRFAVGRSANGRPRDGKEYHLAFSAIPKVRDLIAQFEAVTGTSWTTSISMT